MTPLPCIDGKKSSEPCHLAAALDSHALSSTGFKKGLVRWMERSYIVVCHYGFLHLLCMCDVSDR